MLDEAAEGRDEAAAAAPGDALAAGVAVVHDRPAVRDDDQLAPGRHGGHPRWRALRRRAAQSASSADVGAGAVELVEVHEPVAQEPRREEPPADVLLARQRHLPVPLRLVEDERAPLGALLDRVDEVAGLAVLASGRRSRRRGRRSTGRAFQSASVTVSPKPSRIDFCSTTCGVHLERVHLDGADVVQVGEDEDVGVAVGRRDRAVVVLPALGVVVRHRADERELHLGVRAAARSARPRSRRAGPSTGRSG